MMVALMRLLIAAVLLTCACVKRVEAPVVPKSVQLLRETAERETAQLEQLREDVEFDTKEQPHQAHVVARGESPLLESNGGRVRLFGDAEATKGISVDNVILLEVLGPDGRILDRAAVGFTEGLIIGRERIDLLGRQAFNFEPGEVNLSALVPDRGAWKLRATVLDNYGIGRVSDVFVVIDANSPSGDDLRSQ
jgi:hypothetical protein